MNTIDYIAQHEGFRSHLYRDNDGSWTFGYGQHINSLTEEQEEYLVKEFGSLGEATKQGLSEEQAKQLLQIRLTDLTNQAIDRWSWFNTLPELAKTVILDMFYELEEGIFDWPHFLDAMEAHDWKDAQTQLETSRLIKQVPHRVYDNINLLERLCA